jgi:hypothetical protein
MISKKNRSKLRKKFLFKKYKYLSPLIATILLVVVSVIIISVIVNWGSAFTRKSLDDISKDSDLKRDDTLFSSFQTYQQRSDGFVFKNLSNKKVEFTHYKIISEDAFKFSDILLPFDSTLQVSSGGQVSIPILCSPSSSYHVNLVTSEGTYVTVPINNIDSELNSCNSPEIPDLVCLGINDNGSGTSEEDPIVICSVDDLNNVRNGLDKHYKLGRNLDLNVSPYNEGEGWLPIGKYPSEGFTGHFDGDRYIINNLYINRPTMDSVGLFARNCDWFEDNAFGAVIKNVVLKDVNVIGDLQVGSLIGFVFSEYEVEISNCSSTGFVFGFSHVGGLVGSNGVGSTVFNSYFTGSVSGFSSVGGLVAYNDGSILNSYSNASIFGNNTVGGLIAFNGNFGNITNSYSLGDVTRLSGSIWSVFGGFLADKYNDAVTNCYSIGKVIYDDEIDPTDKGFSSSSISGNNYWDIETSLQITSGTGATGLTTIEMKDPNNFVGWDFDTVWAIEEGITYPYLRSITYDINNPKPQ